MLNSGKWPQDIIRAWLGIDQTAKVFAPFLKLMRPEQQITPYLKPCHKEYKLQPTHVLEIKFARRTSRPVE